MRKIRSLPRMVHPGSWPPLIPSKRTKIQLWPFIPHLWLHHLLNRAWRGILQNIVLSWTFFLVYGAIKTQATQQQPEMGKILNSSLETTVTSSLAYQAALRLCCHYSFSFWRRQNFAENIQIPKRSSNLILFEHYKSVEPRLSELLFLGSILIIPSVTQKHVQLGYGEEIMDKSRLKDYFTEILFWLLAFVANTEKLVKLDFYTSCCHSCKNKYRN